MDQSIFSPASSAFSPAARMDETDAVFADNRATGRVALAVASGLRGSRVARVHEAGSLRVRFPRSDSGTLEAVVVNTAGGMTGGDRFDLDIKVGTGAKLTVTTVAAEKIYRSLGPDTGIGVRLDVGKGGALAWLPQETILFDRARLRRRIDISLAGDASLVLAEAAIFGRAAMGETVVSGLFFDRWRVRIGGALVYAEAVRLDGKIAELLARRAVANGGVAVASLIRIPGDESSVAAVRAAGDFAGEVGTSTWNGIALARFVAPHGAALRHDLATAARALDVGPLPRLWLN